MPKLCMLLLAASAGCSAATPSVETAQATPAVGTSGQVTATLDGTAIPIFTYRPAGCRITAILLVFHGFDRNASGYRDNAVPLAQRYCMVIAAPLFDTGRFPTRSYQRGGIVHHGAVAPEASWTVRYAPLMAAWARQQEGRPDLPYVQIGHSAGAQFLSRVVAFSPDTARQTILANPSTWVEPSLDTAAPYGFGGAPDGEADLRRYLAAHVTVLLGREDRGSKNLATSEEAEDQGANRYERGQATFAAAQAMAQSHNWPFNWTLAVVPGVGHNARAMFTSDAAFAALHP